MRRARSAINRINESSILDDLKPHLVRSINRESTQDPDTVLNTSRVVIHISRKAAPLAISGIIKILGQFGETYFLSRLDIDSFGATDLVNAILGFVYAPTIYLVIQNAVFASHCYGRVKEAGNRLSLGEEIDVDEVRQDCVEIGKILRQAWLFSLLGGTAAALLFPLSTRILIALGQSPRVVDIVESFLLPYMLAIPPMIGVVSNQHFFLSIDREKWLIPFNIFSVSLRILLNWYLISTFKSIKGAAWAGVIKAYTEFLAYIIFMAIKNDFKAFKLFSMIKKEDFLYMKKMLSQGWPYALRSLLLSGQYFFIKNFIGHYGSLRLVIDQVVSSYYSTALNLSDATTAATSQLTAQALGRANKLSTREAYDSVRKYGNVGIIMSESIFISASAIILFFHLPLTRLLIPAQVADDNSSLISSVFFIAAATYIFDELRSICSDTLSAMEDTFYSSMISIIINVFMVVLLAAISTYVFDWDIIGIDVVVALGAVMSAAFLFSKWVSMSNKIVENVSFNYEEETSNAKFNKKCDGIKQKITTCKAILFRERIGGQNPSHFDFEKKLPRHVSETTSLKKH